MADNPVVAGVFCVPFTKQSDSVTGLGTRAVKGLLAETGLDPDSLDAAVAGTVFGGSLVGQRVLKQLSMTGMPVINVENACATGGTAVHVACALIRSGQAKAVLAFGVERLSALGGGTLPLDRTDIEVAQGSVMPAVYAMRANRYLSETACTPADLAAVSVKNRANGAHNPTARFQQPVTLEQVLESPMIADPLTLLQCSPNVDGAAAVLVCAPEFGRDLGTPTIEIRASVVISGTYSGGPRDMTWPDITLRAVAKAYQQGGISAPDVDVAEVHDAFSIAEILYYEALGFCQRGQGTRWLADGGPEIGGEVAVNPSGGLISRGHPVGVTGIAQIAESYWQLTGVAGDRQVSGAEVALTHVTGGGISGVDNGACAVHVLSA